MKDVQEFLGLEHSDKVAEFLRTNRINSSYGGPSRENPQESRPASVPKTPWKDWAESEKHTFSKIAAETMVGRDGNRSEALDHERLQEILQRFNRLQ